MIVYRLRCAGGHDFEGWFASPEAYGAQREAGRVECPSCGARSVDKLPSAPFVNTGARGDAMPAPAPEGARPVANVLAAMKAFLEANTEDVGRRFPEVARRIHYGEEDHRGIRGRVTAEEAAALAEEGVPAVPLPPGIVLGEDVH